MTPTHQICADIAATMDRVRELDIEGHARAAALQCLADARRHLGHAVRSGLTGRIADWEGCTCVGGSLRPNYPEHFPYCSLVGVWPSNHDRDTEPMMRVAPSVPPSCVENARVRTEAGQAFRRSREILKSVLK